MESRIQGNSFQSAVFDLVMLLSVCPLPAVTPKRITSLGAGKATRLARLLQ
jgi:Na+-translocating ferredoxin:NAD+ oxidoreductase RnfE subunit